MAKSYWGKILRVNLTTKEITIETKDDEFFRTYVGGRGLIAYYLLNEVPADAEPLGPENKLIMASGVLTGTPLAGSGRHSIGALSPLTGGYGDGESGGYWGVEFKKTGFDAVIVEGKSEKPVYLWIHDGVCEIKDASPIYGKTTLEAQNYIKESLDDEKIQVAQCGPAGERLVRYACVTHNLRHFVGRCGIGAVMGSKNLRAVAVRGTKRIEMHDLDKARTLNRWMAENHEKYAAGFKFHGTMGSFEPLSKSGGLPTRNFKEGSYEYAANLGATELETKYLTKRENCYYCPVRCKPVVKIDNRYVVSEDYGGPEYETVAAFGSNCDIRDLEAVSYLNQLCNAYGIDTISCGTTISFAIECYELGLITKEQTDGLDLRFNNPEAVIALVEKINKREGFGDLLAEGSYRAALKLGPKTMPYAMQVKGQELPMHEPRFKMALGVGYGLSPTGADHCHNAHDALFEAETKHLSDMQVFWKKGIFPPIDLSPNKADLLIYGTVWRNLANNAGMCTFLPWDYEQILDIFEASTGWEMTLEEMVDITHRTWAMTRIINNLRGFDTKDDIIPERFFTPFESGPLEGVAVDEKAFHAVRERFYSLRGWDQEGIPTPETLDCLKLSWLKEAT